MAEPRKDVSIAWVNTLGRPVEPGMDRLVAVRLNGSNAKGSIELTATGRSLAELSPANLRPFVDSLQGVVEKTLGPGDVSLRVRAIQESGVTADPGGYA